MGKRHSFASEASSVFHQFFKNHGRNRFRLQYFGDENLCCFTVIFFSPLMHAYLHKCILKARTSWRTEKRPNHNQSFKDDLANQTWGFCVFSMVYSFKPFIDSHQKISQWKVAWAPNHIGLSYCWFCTSFSVFQRCVRNSLCFCDISFTCIFPTYIDTFSLYCDIYLISFISGFTASDSNCQNYTYFQSRMVWILWRSSSFERLKNLCLLLYLSSIYLWFGTGIYQCNQSNHRNQWRTVRMNIKKFSLKPQKWFL